MSLVLSWFSESIEFQMFGINLVTFGAVGANVFTCMQAWGLHKQYRTICRRKRADGVSLSFFVFSTGYCAAFLYYGWISHSITITWNGMLAPLFGAVVIAIIRYRGITFPELCATIFAPVLVIAMVFIERKTLLLLTYLFLFLLFLLAQPLKIIRERNSREVSLSFQYICIATSVFWFSYAIAIKDIALIIFNPIVFLLYAWTIVLCRKYGNIASPT